MTVIDMRHRGRRRTLPLSGGLTAIGARGTGPVARTLSHPLADYYLMLVATALLVGVGVLMMLFERANGRTNDQRAGIVRTLEALSGAYPDRTHALQ